MSELDNQLRLAVNKGLISQSIADEISEGLAMKNTLQECQNDIEDCQDLYLLWWHCQAKITIIDND